MLPDFTGVLAVRPKYYLAGVDYMYRPYLNGRRVNDWDAGTREDAEIELSDALEQLAGTEAEDA